MKLQVAGFLEHSTVNGIGLRSVLFLSGCPHHCPYCQNETMQNYDYGESIDDGIILSRILKNSPLLEGVTLSGGEPFEQAKALLPLVKAIKAHKLTLWCYTGYTYDELLQDPDKQQLLTYIDVLVDGPFINALKDENLKYRGSSNQHVYELIDGKINRTLYEID